MIHNEPSREQKEEAKLKSAPIENSKNQGGRPVEGAITKQIGSGEYAKDTFIYITIRWSFVIGCVMSAAFYVKSYFDAMDAMEYMKSVWAIFMPVITLALGYSFGKGR